MKLNEAKYRSPKWLRNYVDFEVNTGDDIKGEPSKRKADKLEKERQEKLRAEAEAKAAAKAAADRKARKAREDQARYEEWNKQAKKQNEQQQIERELNTLYQSIISDFSANRYSDKISTPQRNGKTAFYYTFENGKVLKIYKNTTDNRYCLEWETTIYTLGVEWSSKFISLANEIVKKGGPRPQRSGYDRYDSYGKGSSQSSGYKQSSGSSSGQRASSTGHPKGNLYNTLKQTIKQREEQLSKMSKQDPSRVALENELANAKTKVADMKKKYQFENLKSFEDFID